MNKKFILHVMGLIFMFIVPACSPNPIIPDNVEQLSPLVTIEDDHTKNLTGIEFSADGDLMIALDHAVFKNQEPCEVVLWYTATGKEHASQNLDLWALSTAAFHPNKPLVALGGSNSAVYLWDFNSGETTLVTAGIPWSPDGSAILSDGSIIEMVPVTSLAFSPDGAILAVGYSEVWGHSTVELYDMTEGAKQGNIQPYWTHTIEYGGYLTLAFDPNGKILMVSHANDIYLWEPISGELLQQHHLSIEDLYITDLTLSQDGKILLTTTPDQTYFWDRDTFEKIDKLNHLGGLKALNLDASIMAFIREDEVSLWDIQTGEQLSVLDVPAASFIGFSPDGTLLTTVGKDDILRLWGIPEP
jgi:WD40 repeat protein